MGKMGFLLGGQVTIEITCADPAKTLQNYVDKGLYIHDPILKEPMVLQISVPRSQENLVISMAEKRGESCKIIGNKGLTFLLKCIKKRWVFIFALLVILVSTLLAPKKVWFVCVEGNTQMEKGEIIAVAEQCGLNFWADVDGINRQQFKNQLMKELPNIQWAGLNFNGGIATICIYEKPESEQLPDTADVSDVVAARDGLILSVDALQGQSLCQVGQAVKAGEVLITGCIEHPYQMQYTCANGEVYAMTQREVTGILPVRSFQKVYTKDQKLRLYLILGRNKIKFFGNSGISDMNCDRMRTVRDMLLPGGYKLPFSLVIEHDRPYELVEAAHTGNRELEITQYLDSYVQEDMIAGEILHRKLQLEEKEEHIEFLAIYTCREMIARQKKVLWFEGEDTNDGTHR